MPEDKVTEKILLVYIGARIGADNTLIHFWLHVTQNEFHDGIVPPDSQLRAYGKVAKKRLTTSVGACYEVSQTCDGKSIFPTESKYIGLWPNDAQRFLWQAVHREAVTTIELEKKAAKEGKEDDFAELQLIRERYSKLISRNQKAALLAQVIAYITG